MNMTMISSIVINSRRFCCPANRSIVLINGNVSINSESNCKNMSTFNKKKRYIHTSQTLCYKQNKSSEMRIKLLRMLSATTDKIVAVMPRVVQDQYDAIRKGFKVQYRQLQYVQDASREKKKSPPGYVTYRGEMAKYLLYKDLLKTAWMLPVFMMPFGLVLVFIPIFAFPRYVLPDCYWTKSQRSKYLSQLAASRSVEYGLIVNHLKFHKNNLVGDMQSQKNLDKIINLVTEGDVPTTSMLLPLLSICRNSSNLLHHKFMPYPILKSFCDAAFIFPFKPPSWMRHSLAKEVQLVLEMDRKLRYENAISGLSNLHLEYAALMRGLNSVSLSPSANRYYLKHWVELTKHCNDDDVSFVLHAMVLLSFNYNETKFQRRVFG